MTFYLSGMVIVNPARAGMILMSGFGDVLTAGKPRASGDDPSIDVGLPLSSA